MPYALASISASALGLLPRAQTKCLVYLLYYYKRTNTDANSPAERQALDLLPRAQTQVVGEAAGKGSVAAGGANAGEVRRRMATIVRRRLAEAQVCAREGSSCWHAC
jgi:hypothetical protein